MTKFLGILFLADESEGLLKVSCEANSHDVCTLEALDARGNNKYSRSNP